MATLNSIDGVINSGGSNPPLNTEFPCTLYRMDFPATGGSIEFIRHTGEVRSFTFSNFALTDRIKKINSISGVKLTDLGLVFNISMPTPAPTFVDLNSLVRKDLNLKTYRVYFGNPLNVSATIDFINENGAPQRLSLLGTTQTIKTTKITNVFGLIRLEDLNPDVPAIKKVIPPPIGFQSPLSLATGTYGTISSPIAQLSFLNAPIVPLVSGGNNPVLNTVFAATNYDFDFPTAGTGTIEYIDNNRKLKTYTLNKFQIQMPNGLLSDGVIQFNKIDGVKVIDKGRMYNNVEPADAKFIVPTSMPLLPQKPKFYRIYFGNPVCPQGSIIYFDAKGANKAITKFGGVVVIDAYSIYSFWNVKIEEAGDYVDANGNGVGFNWVNPQNPENKYPVGY